MDRRIPQKSVFGREQGFALVLALFVVAAVMILGMSVLTMSMLSSQSSHQMGLSQQNFQVADAGAELGKNWLLQFNIPPEGIQQVTDNPPFKDYTEWSNELNPIDPDTGQPYPYPQFRYKVEHDSESAITTGESITVGKEYGGEKPYWHFYTIKSESRGGRTTALGHKDRVIYLTVRRMYLH